ncbi:hypothetical protein M514_12356 [Trichuris suis]|uniref:Uncharacterized protein n=1 Tax=Trichuris suis TaxID=68888 RepID=A0A085MTJ0_9BILA|nr:hypothetical protein M514_12356 [Trichuris suis]
MAIAPFPLQAECWYDWCSVGRERCHTSGRAVEWEPKGLLNCRRRKGERAIEWEPKGLLNCRRRKGY